MNSIVHVGIKRYHQVSTDQVYVDRPDLLVLAYHRTYGLPVTISRCSNNYGQYHFREK